MGHQRQPVFMDRTKRLQSYVCRNDTKDDYRVIGAVIRNSDKRALSRGVILPKVELPNFG